MQEVVSHLRNERMRLVTVYSHWTPCKASTLSREIRGISQKKPVPLNGKPIFKCLEHRTKIPVVACITAYNEPWTNKPPNEAKDSGTLRATLAGVVGNIEALRTCRDHWRLPRNVLTKRTIVRVSSTSFSPDVGQRVAHAIAASKQVPSATRRCGCSRATGNQTPYKKEERLSSRDFVALEPLRSLSEEDIVVIVVFDGRDKVHKSMYMQEEGDPQVQPPLTTEDFEMMKACISPITAQEAAAAKEHDDKYTAAVLQAKYNNQVAPKKEPYVKPSTRHCHLVQRKFVDDASRASVNVIYAIKDQNGGKLNSHLWAFRGIMPFLDPKYVVLLDAGTIPSPTAILRLYADMEYDANVGGSCGEIMVDTKQRSCQSPVVMAQHFEYTMANLLDKAFESTVGYIGVLPGAFSAYRLEALEGAPLRAYFMLEHGKSSGSEKRREQIREAKAAIAQYANETEPDNLAYIGRGCCMDVADVIRDIFKFFGGLGLTLCICSKQDEVDDGEGLHPATANMYLAEDRILGFEIVAAKGHKWTLRYNHAAQAATDVPETVERIISQRRRWLNGSFFAMLYTLGLWHRLIIGTKHAFLQKLCFLVIYLWNVSGVVLAWLSIGNAYIAILVVFDVVGSLSSTGMSASGANPACASVTATQGIVALAYSFLVWVYQILLAILIVVGLGNKKMPSKLWPRVTFVLAIINAVTIGVALSQVRAFSFIVLTTGLGSIAFFFICALVQGRFFQIVFSVAYYVFMMPLFIVIIPVYSFCNTHDISWGTRDGGGHSGDKSALEARYATFRSGLVLFWLGTNWTMTQIFERLARGSTSAIIGGMTAIQWYAISIAVLAAFTLLVRVCGCFTYVFYEIWKTTPESRCFSRACRECRCFSAKKSNRPESIRTTSSKASSSFSTITIAAAQSDNVEGSPVTVSRTPRGRSTMFNNPIARGPSPMPPAQK